MKKQAQLIALVTGMIAANMAAADSINSVIGTPANNEQAVTRYINVDVQSSDGIYALVREQQVQNSAVKNVKSFAGNDEAGIDIKNAL